MNFDFNDDQHSIKRTARELLADRFGPNRVRALAEAREQDGDVFLELAGLGWTGIHLPEESGGQGLGIVELVILMEELGYALAPVPLLGTVAAGLAIHAAGGEDQRDRWLAPLAAGRARGAVGAVRGGPDGEALVVDAGGADLIVLLDEDGGGCIVEAGAAQVEPVATIDQTRAFARVRAGGAGEPLAGDASAALDRIETILAAELIGIAQRAMEMAVEYARERKQFGRPVGAYQAVSHRCAQMLLEVEGARSLCYHAAWAADFEPETLPLAASMAKAYAADAGWRVSASSLQVHGGIGFTWEHDLHFFLKRARVDGTLFGSARMHRERVAERAGLTAAAPA